MTNHQATGRGKGEDGSVLLICLVFTTIFGLIMAALLSQAEAHIKHTQIVSKHDGKVYAADAGISHAIDVMRSMNTLCPSVAATPTPLPDVAVGGQTVKTSCITKAGSTTGIGGYAIVTTLASGNSLVIQSGLSKHIEGPVFLNGTIDWGPGIEVKGGDVKQRASTCSGGAAPTAPTSLQLSFIYRPPFDWYCTTEATPNPDHVPPTFPLSVAVPGSATCKVYRPGVYTTPLSISSNAYFGSGTYYFTQDVTVDHATLVGGQPTSFDSLHRKLVLPSGCPASDAGIVGANGQGVEFVFGGGARLNISTQGAAELFTRASGTDGGTQGISLVAVPSDWPAASGWLVHTATSTLDIKEGDQQKVAIHGMVYAPGADVHLAATNDVIAQVLSGVLARTLELKSSASANGLAVSVAESAADPRQVVLTSTAGEVSERRVQATAVVKIKNDATSTVEIQSWRESYIPS
jgi:hypothetical protein